MRGSDGYLTADDFDHPPLAYEERVVYGPDPLQHADLRLPDGPGPHPVAVVVHGGCWRALHTRHHIEPFAAALTGAGWATWNLEHRSIVHHGGGWPGTFLDVAAGTDRLRDAAAGQVLDLTRVVTVGHSSGGHLALWLAARHRLAAGSELRGEDPLPMVGAVGLGAITDPWAFHEMEERACGAAVLELMGGTPDEVPYRYAQGSPAELLPIGVPQLLVHGADDRRVPLAHVEAYARRAVRGGDDVRVVEVPRAAHFEVIAPAADPWPGVAGPLFEFLGRFQG